MEAKKSIKANLENKRSTFFQIGLALTMAVALLVFESKGKKETVIAYNPDRLLIDDFIDNTVITKPEKPLPPPPPKMLNTVIKVVEDDSWQTLLEDIDKLDPHLFDNGPNYTYLPESEDKDTIFIKVEKMPMYKGGDERLFRQDAYKLLKYPRLAEELGIQGTVYVRFVIDKTGKMTDIEILRSDDSLFNKEVLRVLSKLDNWTPGMQRDKYVNVSYSMPFSFRLPGI